MELGTDKRSMKQKIEITPWITVPMFMIGLIIFIIVGISVKTNTLFIQSVDLGSLHWLTQHIGEPERHFGSHFWQNVMTLCAEIGEVKSVIYITVVLALILLFKHYRLSLWIIFTIGTGTLLNYLIKQMIERPRPYNHLLRDHGYSFPSGHSNASTLLALILLIVVIPMIKIRAIQIIANIVTTMVWIGILCCRLYFHAHYITDVVGGVSLGMLWVALYLMILPLFYFNFPKKTAKHI